ncbi:response regulator [Methylobacterium organophilum]|uniref:hybrid sensor histidine kinase/response regulator n=1 Tax=Methylobacterium organophilum TaxID=410 RepID=UPI001F137443|nr:response regulator [Methylobacterium organophilum]UMY16274.1 response regulator [Methylobacterium organophilum]
MDIRRQLLEAFDLEHREHLEAIRTALAGGAEGRAPDWNDVFRRAHSLKGAARAVDLPPVETIAHRLETLFEQVRDGRRALDGAVMAASHLALDRIEAFVAGTKTGTPSMPPDALAALDACLAGWSPAAEPAPAPPPPKEAAPAEPVPEIPPDPAQAVLRVPATTVQALALATYDLAGTLPGQAAVSEGLRRIAASAARLRRQTERLRGGEAERGRTDLSSLEAALADLARDAADLARSQVGTALALENAAARVREEAERLALVPAETVFGGFARTLRETARGEGREVDVRVRGLDLPVDRVMLQVLKDPVLHVLRNALSHGFEPPETRIAAGKPASLVIRFEVALRAGRLEIAVRDDGRGPDLPAIEARARAAGLLAPGERAERERLLGFVFEPGFSTSAAVDTLSGRGIGLSVVAEAVRRLQGSARLEPGELHGSALVMSLPLSAARCPVLVVEAGGAAYALPADAVVRLLRLTPEQRGRVQGRPVASLPAAGGATETLPVVDLAALLGAAEDQERDGPVAAVLLRAGSGRRFVLVAERLREVRTCLLMPAPPIGLDAMLATGTVILEAEIPALVLDPDFLLSRAVEGAAIARRDGIRLDTSPDGTLAASRRSTVLVVDDSITTRTLEKSILEAAGYRVVVCVDGQDALDTLRSGLEPIDLVVADVEMPRLDGFGLVKALRGQDAFANLPVILMTSRGDAEDVARGLDLGASAYLTKQKFDQRELLDTIGQLL